jgi:hypothetical protein
MRRYWDGRGHMLTLRLWKNSPSQLNGPSVVDIAFNIRSCAIASADTPVWMTGVSLDTGRMAAERGHVVGTLLSGAVAGPLFEAYRQRAQELGWTVGPDRFAYAAVVGVGATREEGRRRVNLAADYVRTSPIVLEPFTNSPGYNSLGTNVAMLKSGGKRSGFVRDRPGNPVDHTTATLEQLMESATCFAGTPDDVCRSPRHGLRRRPRRNAPDREHGSEGPSSPDFDFQPCDYRNFVTRQRRGGVTQAPVARSAASPGYFGAATCGDMYPMSDLSPPAREPAFHHGLSTAMPRGRCVPFRVSAGAPLAGRRNAGVWGARAMVWARF